MVKRIIFDLDNTLIMWEDSYYNTLNQTLDYYKIAYSEEIISKLIKAVDTYEDYYDVYNMKFMKDHMEKCSNIVLPTDFVYKWTLYLEKCIPDKDLDEFRKCKEYIYEQISNFEEEEKNNFANSVKWIYDREK